MATTDTTKPTETIPAVEIPPKSPAAAPTSDLPVDPPAAENGSETNSDDLKTAPKAEDAAAPAGEAASVIENKMKRAERFGISVLLTEEEKRNSRAERFGTVPTSKGSDGTKKAEDLKRKARAERFGIAAAAPMASDEDARKKARLARFAPASKTAAKPDPQEEEKRKARSLRFSNGSAASLSSK